MRLSDLIFPKTWSGFFALVIVLFLMIAYAFLSAPKDKKISNPDRDFGKYLSKNGDKKIPNWIWAIIFLFFAFVAYKIMSFDNFLDKKDKPKKENSVRIGSGGEVQKKAYH